MPIFALAQLREIPGGWPALRAPSAKGSCRRGFVDASPPPLLGLLDYLPRAESHRFISAISSA